MTIFVVNWFIFGASAINLARAQKPCAMVRSTTMGDQNLGSLPLNPLAGGAPFPRRCYCLTNHYRQSKIPLDGFLLLNPHTAIIVLLIIVPRVVYLWSRNCVKCALRRCKTCDSCISCTRNIHHFVHGTWIA